MVNIKKRVLILHSFIFADMLANFNAVSRSNTPFSVKDILNLPEDTFLNYSTLDKMFMDALNINCNAYLHNSPDSQRWDVGNNETTNIYQTSESYSQDNEYKNLQRSSPPPSASVPQVQGNSSSICSPSIPVPFCSSPDATSSIYTSIKSENSLKLARNAFNNAPEWPTNRVSEEGASDQSDAPTSNSKCS